MISDYPTYDRSSPLERHVVKTMLPISEISMIEALQGTPTSLALSHNVGNTFALGMYGGGGGLFQDYFRHMVRALSRSFNLPSVSTRPRQKIPTDGFIHLWSDLLVSFRLNE